MTEPHVVPPPDLLVEVADGRRVAVDDRGDPAGVPVLYLHGCPDSRLARHPDDGIAAAQGVRLLAVDRPGLGGTDPMPGASVDDVVGDLLGVLDGLAVDRAVVLAWSAGAVHATHLAALAPDRVSALALACPAAPPAAGDDPEVAAAAGVDRLGMWEAAAEWGAANLAAEAVHYLLPHPITWDAAVAHAGHGDPPRARELAAVPGGLEQMALSALAALAQGQAGVRDDLARLLSTPTTRYDAITAPTRIWVGTADAVTPPAFAHWYAARIREAEVCVVEGHSHALTLARWEELLAWCVIVGSGAAAEASHAAPEPTTRGTAAPTPDQSAGPSSM